MIKIEHIYIIVLLLFLLPINVQASFPWKGIMFSPKANIESSHEQFLIDFKRFVKVIKNIGINTIIFDMNYGAYKFSFDEKLNKAYYPKSKGFTKDEVRSMARIARRNNMNIIVAYQILTHSVGNIYNDVYSEFMLKGDDWELNTLYKKDIDFIYYNKITYKSKKDHVSSIASKPGESDYWEEYNSDTRDPFNVKGEIVIFNIIDELIDAFSVDGVDPDGFHIGCDELHVWYRNPQIKLRKTSSEIFSFAVTNVFNHIKKNHAYMEVIMWGDMLDKHWNGAFDNKNTADSINIIPSDIIIADWRYKNNNIYRYSYDDESFPSVREFAEKGFRVWTTSWYNVKATTDLIWTGNMEYARSGMVVGHLYSTWLFGVVPEMSNLLIDPEYVIHDYVLSGIDESLYEKYREYYRGIADSIISTVGIIQNKSCRGTDYYCGSYPNCVDVTKNNGFYQKKFRSYYCNKNNIDYKNVDSPNDYKLHISFDTDNDFKKKSINNKAKKIFDNKKDKILSIHPINYPTVINDEYLFKNNNDISINVWFKSDKIPNEEFGTILSNNPGMRDLTIFIDQKGRIVFQKNVNKFYIYSTTGFNYLDDNWHHIVAMYNYNVPKLDLYVDGVQSNGITNFTDNNSVLKFKLYIGSINEKSKYLFNGLVDDIMIYNRLLTHDEIKLLMKSQYSHRQLINNSKIPRPQNLWIVPQ